MPNFDNCRKFLDNDFPHRGYVLVCTSDARETLKLDSRKRFLKHALGIAAGRPTVFKLHPNENAERATREIHAMAPGARVFSSGPTEAMIANCDVLVTQFSSVVFVGLALGKEVHSHYPLEVLRPLVPEQHGRAARNIAAVARDLLSLGHRQGRGDRRGAERAPGLVPLSQGEVA
jgi:hypothetical protein